MDRKTFLQSVAAMFAVMAVPFQGKKKPHAGKTVNTIAGSCDTCTFYLQIGTGTTGSCIRYPKVWLTASQPNQSGWSFPVMNGSDVCGEFNKGA